MLLKMQFYNWISENQRLYKYVLLTDEFIQPVNQGELCTMNANSPMKMLMLPYNIIFNIGLTLTGGVVR